MLYSLKNKQYFWLLLFFLSFQINMIGQDWIYADIEWDESKEIPVLDAEYADDDAVILKRHLYYHFDPNYESQTNQYLVEHKKVLLNSDKAIEQNNKIYLNQYSKELKQIIKTRVLNQKGEVRELKESDIKQGVDEESGAEYSYYAVEGLEIGSMIETVTKMEVSPSFYGTVHYIEQSYPTLDYKFVYTYPRFLTFKFKTYNSDLEGTIEDADKTSTYTLSSTDVPRILSEPMAHRKSNSAYLIYKLDKNHSQGMNDINGFGFFNQAIGERILQMEIGKGERKKLDKLYSGIVFDNDDTDSDKICRIESYIKENFAFVDNNTVEELEDMKKILENKALNFFGAGQIYQYFLNKIDKKIAVIATCDNSKFKFDKKFENYLFLQKKLISIEGTDIIIDPEDELGRLSYIDPAYLGNDGLFVRSKTLGSMTTAVGKVETIPHNKPEENLLQSYVDVQIEEEFDDIKIEVDMEFRGQVAKNSQPIFALVDEEQLENFYTYALYTYSDHLKVKTAKFKNNEKGAFPLEPLLADFEIKGENFLEKGGRSYFLKVGEMIGPQSQMYYEEETERVNEVFSQYPREYRYQIRFNIPDGYTAENLDDIKIMEESSRSEHRFFFKSDYTLEGNQVTITINELYDSSTYPVEVFTDYQKVINAAADFNKVKILFSETE